MNSAITEIDLDSERSQLITAVTKDSAEFLNLDLSTHSANKIVSTVDEVITNIVFGESTPIPEDEEKDLLLGCLWASQFVRELGWSWQNIDQDGSLDIAIVSPFKDMLIFPFTFINKCIHKHTVCTVELAYNMIKERRNEPVFQPGDYENVMNHIKHIIPPYTLEPQS